jgi:hypothetical protein
MIRRSRRTYLQLCPFCDAKAGPCDHARELWNQARGRARSFTKPVRLPWRPYTGPWVADRPGEVGLRWPESSRGPGLPSVRRVARPPVMRLVGSLAG